jgi:ribosome-binding factor A
VSRTQKLASQIRHAICQILERELKDPHLGFITITGVDISPDLQLAKVYFTAFGEAKQKEISEKTLVNAAGFIRSRLAKHVRMRYTPVLDFKLDDSLEYSRKIDDIFKKINKGKA